jgi:hypothetical protein
MCVFHGRAAFRSVEHTMKGGLIAVAAVAVVLGPVAGVVVGQRVLGPLDVKPGPVPESDGTPACNAARAFLQQMNADVARFNARLNAVQKEIAAAKTTAAKAEAENELRALRQNEKKFQSAVNGQSKTAADQCKPTEPTKGVIANELVLPDDNGTPACKTVRAQMKYLIDERRKVMNNLDRQYWKGSLGLSDAAKRQLEKRKARLEAQFRALAPKGATACKKHAQAPSPPTPTPAAAPFTGIWTGTYHEGSNDCTDGKSGAATMTLTQTDTSLTGSATYQGYVIGEGCATVELHSKITGNVVNDSGLIRSTYDHGGGTVDGTLALSPDGKTLTLTEGPDEAMFARG